MSCQRCDVEELNVQPLILKRFSLATSYLIGWCILGQNVVPVSGPIDFEFKR